MKTHLITIGAGLALIASPAAAQLLGGGGLVGNVGASLGGSLGGVGNVSSGASGALAGSARVERSIDTRSGRTRADANGNASGSASGGGNGGLLSGNASSSSSGGASADAQAVGTDALTSVAGSLTGRASSAAGAGAAGGPTSLSQGGLLTLVGAGSAAASGAGAFSISPGMIVRDTSGRAIGEVESVRTSANGVVDTVLVNMGNSVAALPANNFSVSGETLVSAMSRGEVRNETTPQAN